MMVKFNSLLRWICSHAGLYRSWISLECKWILINARTQVSPSDCIKTNVLAVPHWSGKAIRFMSL